MTTEQELIKKVVAAADSYATSKDYVLDETPSEERLNWEAAFQELRAYAETLTD